MSLLTGSQEEKRVEQSQIEEEGQEEEEEEEDIEVEEQDVSSNRQIENNTESYHNQAILEAITSNQQMTEMGTMVITQPTPLEEEKLESKSPNDDIKNLDFELEMSGAPILNSSRTITKSQILSPQKQGKTGSPPRRDSDIRSSITEEIRSEENQKDDEKGNYGGNGGGDGDRGFHDRNEGGNGFDRPRKDKEEDFEVLWGFLMSKLQNRLTQAHQTFLEIMSKILQNLRTHKILVWEDLKATLEKKVPNPDVEALLAYILQGDFSQKFHINSVKNPHFTPILKTIKYEELQFPIARICLAKFQLVNTLQEVLLHQTEIVVYKNRVATNKVNFRLPEDEAQEEEEKHKEEEEQQRKNSSQNNTIELQGSRRNSRLRIKSYFTSQAKSLTPNMPTDIRRNLESLSKVSCMNTLSTEFAAVEHLKIVNTNNHDIDHQIPHCGSDRKITQWKQDFFMWNLLSYNLAGFKDLEAKSQSLTQAEDGSELSPQQILAKLQISFPFYSILRNVSMRPLLLFNYALATENDTIAPFEFFKRIGALCMSVGLYGVYKWDEKEFVPRCSFTQAIDCPSFHVEEAGTYLLMDKVRLTCFYERTTNTRRKMLNMTTENEDDKNRKVQDWVQRLLNAPITEQQLIETCSQNLKIQTAYHLVNRHGVSDYCLVELQEPTPYSPYNQQTINRPFFEYAYSDEKKTGSKSIISEFDLWNKTNVDENLALQMFEQYISTKGFVMLEPQLQFEELDVQDQWSMALEWSALQSRSPMILGFLLMLAYQKATLNGQFHVTIGKLVDFVKQTGDSYCYEFLIGIFPDRKAGATNLAELSQHVRRNNQLRS